MLKEQDPKIYNAIQNELKRQREGLELIPSENLVSKAVLEAMGSVLTNKYSEGYPGKRYYGGNEFIDVAEQLAIDRAKKLFGCDHVNVQPYSGSPANLAVYFALLEPGDKFMGLKLSEGGHLTHGHKVNFSSQYYTPCQYGVGKKDELLDFDEIRKIAKAEKPKMIEAGYTAYPREIDWKQFREICDEVGALFWVDIAHIAGLIAGGAHPSPIPYADVITTTTHKTLRGPRAAIIMCKEEYAKAIDKAVFPGLQGGPHNHINAGKAVCFKEAMQPEFKEYSAQIVKNAKALGDVLAEGNLRLISGGTDTHLLLVDLTDIGVPGKQAEEALDSAGLYVNKNTIPFDPRSPFDPSGIRLGTPVLTTRGMKEKDMQFVGESVIKAVNNHQDTKVLKEIRKDVMNFCEKFPIYEGL
ncbi:serine hydroxymethyltransferase [Nanoarchaeota archaeon]